MDDSRRCCKMRRGTSESALQIFALRSCLRVLANIGLHARQSIGSEPAPWPPLACSPSLRTPLVFFLFICCRPFSGCNSAGSKTTSQSECLACVVPLRVTGGLSFCLLEAKFDQNRSNDTHTRRRRFSRSVRKRHHTSLSMRTSESMAEIRTPYTTFCALEILKSAVFKIRKRN